MISQIDRLAKNCVKVDERTLLETSITHVKCTYHARYKIWSIRFQHQSVQRDLTCSILDISSVSKSDFGCQADIEVWKGVQPSLGMFKIQHVTVEMD